MHNFVIEYLENKRKAKINVFSFTDSINFGILSDYDIDILRFDLDEFSEINGYKDKQRVSAEEYTKFLSNINNRNLNNKIIAADVPLSVVSSGTSESSLEKVLEFYKDSNVDALVFDISYNVFGILDKLSKSGVPVIINSCNKTDNAAYLNRLKTRIIETESLGAVMIMLENASKQFVEELKSNMSIPIVSDLPKVKSDGYYYKYSSLFGLMPGTNSKYLNLFDLITDAVKDCLIDYNES